MQGQLSAGSMAQPNNTQLAGLVSTVSFLGGVFGFTRIRRERPGTVIFTTAPAIEQINEAGHEAGAASWQPHRAVSLTQLEALPGTPGGARRTHWLASRQMRSV